MRIAVCTFLMLVLYVPVGATPYSEKVASSKEVLSSWVERGLLEADLDSLHAGSKWEVARLVGRLLQQTSTFSLELMSDDDRNQLLSLAREYKNELELMGFEPDWGREMTDITSVSAFRGDSLYATMDLESYGVLHLGVNGAVWDVGDGNFSERRSLSFFHPSSLFGMDSLENYQIRLDWQPESGWMLGANLELFPSLYGSIPGDDLQVPMASDLSPGFDVSRIGAGIGVGRTLSDTTAVNLDIRYFSTRRYYSLGRQHQDESAGWQVNTHFVVRF